MLIQACLSPDTRTTRTLRELPSRCVASTLTDATLVLPSIRGLEQAVKEFGAHDVGRLFRALRHVGALDSLVENAALDSEEHREKRRKGEFIFLAEGLAGSLTLIFLTLSHG